MHVESALAADAWRYAADMYDPRGSSPMKLQQKAEMLGEKTFLGVPVRDFEKGGRELLIYLLNVGLNPASRVVDIGCGVLRGGYWLIHFLDPWSYCGIEHHAGRLEMGTRTILEP